MKKRTFARVITFGLMLLQTLYVSAQVQLFSAISPSGHTIYYNWNDQDGTWGNYNSVMVVSSPSVGNGTYSASEASEAVIIPDTVTYGSRKYAVTRIKSFMAPALTDITIPSTVRTIDMDALDLCGFSTLRIPVGITNVGAGIAMNCPNLTTIYYNAREAHLPASSCGSLFSWTVREIVIGDSVKYIPKCFCSQRDSLRTITIRGNIRSIGENAFFNCRSLRTVNVLGNIDTIGESAFQGCLLLESVTIPVSTKSIGDYAFSHCSSLREVHYNAEQLIATSHDVWSTPFYNSKPKTVYLSESVTAIDMLMFGNNDSLRTIISKAQTPPTIATGYYSSSSANLYSIKNVNVIAPCGYADAYRNANWWGLNNRNTIFDDCVTVAAESNDTSLGHVEGGSICSPGTTLTLYALPNVGNVFYGWSDGNMDNPRIVVSLAEDNTFTALFATKDTMFIHDTTVVLDTVTKYLTIFDTTVIHDTTYFDIPFAVHDTIYIDVPYDVHDTTFLVVHDTTYIDVPYTIHDTTIIFDTLIEYVPVTVKDTIYLPVYLHDTTTVRDTTYLPVYLHDTTYIDVHDTAYIDMPFAIHDTTVVIDTLIKYVNIHDTTLITDTMYLPVYFHDTTTVRDTTYLPIYFHDTTYVNVHDTTYIDVPYAVHDTTYIDVPYAVHDTTYINVHDTTYIDVPYAVHDTTYIDVHDTTYIDVPYAVHDTTYIDVHDTTYIDVPYAVHDTTYINVHDTTYIDVPYAVHDTTYINVHDTTYIDVPYAVHDTTYIDVHDTTYIDVPYAVHDTTYIDVHDTTYIDVPYAVHDTTYINVHDTTYIDVPYAVHDTTYINVHDTTYIDVPYAVHDTTYINVHDTTTVTDTVTHYIYDTTIVHDTTLVTDTLWLTQYDTIWLHDTIIIHDTLVVGADEVDALNAKIYTSHGQIVVEGTEDNTVWLYDINGRILATKQDEYSALRFDVPASGTYLIKVGHHPARRVVVIK